MTRRDNRTNETGAALVSAMMVMLLMAALTAAVTVMVIADTQVRTLDNSRTQAFYVAHAGLEKLTSDLGDLFSVNFAPTAAQINALGNTPPPLTATWEEPDGTDGYRINFPVDGANNPVTTTMTVLNGPFQGLIGLATAYQMTSTARLPDRSEASLTRTLQTVAIPVFQFGIFSENDLSFFAGPDFNFGGRVHTNATLYLAEGDNRTLMLSDKVTSRQEVVRTHLQNGWNTNTNYNGTVNVIRSPGLFRALAKTEGSLVNTVGSADNEPTWSNLSTGTYNHNIANGRTGVKRLDLPLVNFNATPADLIRLPPVAEDVNNPNVLRQRFFWLASLRIMLADTAAEISALPTVTGALPVPLGIAEPYAVDATHMPFAESPGINAGAAAGSQQYGVRTPAGTPLLGGFIKIESQTAPGVWQDVTLELLNLGIASRQLVDPANGAPAGCADPSPDGVIRIQRMRPLAACATNNQMFALATSGRNWGPNVLYDTREGVYRDATPDATPLQFGGMIYYIELDARNLTRWFQGAIGATGNQSLSVNGFTVYFSDRRTNRNGAGVSTGEFGQEDIVNPLSGVGAPNGQLDAGEDFNGNNQLDVYGQTPILPAGVLGAPLTAAAQPWTNVGALPAAEQEAVAERNPAIFFRRALKVTRGNLGLPAGLTIASENPVYLQGDWNAIGGTFAGAHSATAILADALTLLSNNWNDRRSLLNPHDQAPRTGTTTWYRMAVLAGKGVSFPQPAGTAQDYGTDGGAHNFLRYIENWGGQTLNFRGSLVSLYTSRQAVGTYKCCADVYSPPTRAYTFDTDFLTPALLPPRTPMFRDVNTTGFQQLLRSK